MFDQVANLKEAIRRREVTQEYVETTLQRASWPRAMFRLIERKHENERALLELYLELRRHEPDCPRGRYEPEPQGQTKEAPAPSRKRSPRGFDGLGQKKSDISQYMDGARLTNLQHDCLSLRLEYGLPVTEIARRLEKHHSTVQYHLKRASEKIEHSRTYESRARNRARPGAG
jgi:DNA-binding CsgD family transcriptional regulator